MIYAASLINRQRQELADTRSTLDSLRQEHSAARASIDSQAKIQEDLIKNQKRLQQITLQLNTTTQELKNISTQSSARERELQKLISFLKEEIKASETQIEVLKHAISSKLEVRKPAP